MESSRRGFSIGRFALITLQFAIVLMLCLERELGLGNGVGTCV
ncbi:hypothetical protein K227x_43350 [Rubripirellula lacrimiformis]|uniref:Uncharacterized protein n=1 Tax=Rubripirellula lacrimiformis TaxID=1930273 RepID=A0A517NFM0_9BACT|nr:hypothetical protein K227x_43350 [Rubripirellula lacrimiformis]